MRIARVLHHESSVTPLAALERDGSLYGVAALEALRATRLATERLEESGDFLARVFALGCAGLADLDEGLRGGFCPEVALLAPEDTFVLPPCDPSRACWVQVLPDGGWALGSARGITASGLAVPLPADDDPVVSLGVAALIGEELRRASFVEAERAVLGFTLIAGWASQSLGGLFVGAQLGPYLVTRDEVPDPAGLVAHVDGAAAGEACSAESIAECIALASHHVDLFPGDVIAAPPLATRNTAFDVRVTLGVERIGTLVARASRGL